MHLAILDITNRCLSYTDFFFNVTDYSLIYSIYDSILRRHKMKELICVEIINIFQKIFILHTYRIFAESFFSYILNKK